MTKEKFIEMLESHDWYFERSDDFRVWKRGVEQRKRIMAAKVILGADGEQIYNQYKKKHPHL